MVLTCVATRQPQRARTQFSPLTAIDIALEVARGTYADTLRLPCVTHLCSGDLDERTCGMVDRGMSVPFHMDDNER